MIYIIMSLILGVTAGVGLALDIVLHGIRKSNDIGDSTGSFEDFGKLKLLDYDDGFSHIQYEKKKKETDGYSTLKSRCNEVLTQFGRKEAKSDIETIDYDEV